MTKIIPYHQQALEACAQDIASFMTMLEMMIQHPQVALLSYGLVAPSAMFVIESHKCITTLFPELQNVISVSHADLLRTPRHRAKLLDDRTRTVDEVSKEFVRIAEEQRRFFLEPHKGFLGPLKRALQPDLGLTTYDGHIIATTHSTIFSFGGNRYIAQQHALEFGEAVGYYTATLFNLLHLKPTIQITATLPGEIEMKDIKYESLYQRSLFRSIPTKFAAGLIYLLATLNYTQYIFPAFLPQDGHTLFRIKFIAAFHANANMMTIQNRLARSSSWNPQVQNLFGKALGNNDSRWLRRQRPLRNLLVHYLLDAQAVNNLPENATRTETIEHLAGGRTYSEIDTLLDRHIRRLSHVLEAGFNLSRNTFWLGRVRNE